MYNAYESHACKRKRAEILKKFLSYLFLIPNVDNAFTNNKMTITNVFSVSMSALHGEKWKFFFLSNTASESVVLCV